MPFALLYGEPTIFLMPDGQSRFVHHLTHSLKDHSGTILIVTPTFRHPELKKAILKEARKGSRITLVAQHLQGDPLSIVQYDRTNLYTYTARPLEGSVIVIDSRLVCTLPGGIDAEKFIRNASIVRCSDNPSEAAAYRSALLPLLERSKQYLK